MKAFVIKNKEGKYLQYFTDMYRFDFTDRLINAMFYEQYEQDSINYALKTIPDCNEVVEITIAEADLEYENKQLEEQHDLLIDEFQKEREELCKQIKQESDARERFVKKVKQLKEQLAEKDKELEELKMSVLFEQEHKNKALDKLKEIRKQVCDEIRKFIDNNEHSEENEAKQSSESVVYTKQLYNLLDQIEQGEQQ